MRREWLLVMSAFLISSLMAETPEVVVVQPLCAPTVAWNQAGKLNEKVKTFCGCDPLAWGQVVTYHALTNKHPAFDWKPTPVTDFVQFPGNKLVYRTTTTEGYNWENVRDQKDDDAARLMWDLGILGHTLYTDVAASGTVSNKRIARYFDYKGQGWTYTLPFYWNDQNQRVLEESWPDLAERLIRGSLHAGAPSVMIMTLKEGGLHAIVCDGYGYSNDGELYLHFHDGWGETSAKWRPLSFLSTEWNPTTRNEGFSVMYVNVHPQELGCVLAGRITHEGKALPNVTVSLSNGQTVQTDHAGAYCFTGLLPQTEYTVRVTFEDNISTKSVKTGRFIDDERRAAEQDNYKDKHIYLEGGNILADFELAQ